MNVFKVSYIETTRRGFEHILSEQVVQTDATKQALYKRLSENCPFIVRVEEPAVIILQVPEPPKMEVATVQPEKKVFYYAKVTIRATKEEVDLYNEIQALKKQISEKEEQKKEMYKKDVQEKYGSWFSYITGEIDESDINNSSRSPVHIPIRLSQEITKEIKVE